MRDVVYAAENKHLRRLPLNNRVDTVDETLNHVRRDATVFHVLHPEQFVPFATVGLAVAEKNDVFLPHRQLTEKRGALEIEFIVDIFFLSRHIA